MFKVIVKNVESQTMEKLRGQFNLRRKEKSGDSQAQDLAGSSVGDGGEDEGGEVEMVEDTLLVLPHNKLGLISTWAKAQ